MQLREKVQTYLTWFDLEGGSLKSECGVLCQSEEALESSWLVNEAAGVHESEGETTGKFFLFPQSAVTLC